MKHSILLAAIFSANFVYAAPLAADQNLINHKDWSFVKNKGQLSDENHKVITDIKYYGHQGGVYLYCKPGIISFVFTKIENDAANGTSEASGNLVETQNIASLRSRQQLHHPFKITTSRMNLVLIGSNPSAEIIAFDKQEFYENYYTTGDADFGIANVYTYKSLVYKNIYRKIDMVLNAGNGQNIEYSFIVHPGGKAKDIQLQWNGVANMHTLNNGGIQYSSLLGSITESKPITYASGKSIKSSFKRTGNIFGFKVGKYNRSKALSIFISTPTKVGSP